MGANVLRATGMWSHIIVGLTVFCLGDYAAWTQGGLEVEWLSKPWITALSQMQWEPHKHHAVFLSLQWDSSRSETCLYIPRLQVTHLLALGLKVTAKCAEFTPFEDSHGNKLFTPPCDPWEYFCRNQTWQVWPCCVLILHTKMIALRFAIDWPNLTPSCAMFLTCQATVFRTKEGGLEWLSEPGQLQRTFTLAFPRLCTFSWKKKKRLVLSSP